MRSVAPAALIGVLGIVWLELVATGGGGGTPLAAGLDTAFMLADSIKRKGQTPTVIVLTDGRANIARDGAPGGIHPGRSRSPRRRPRRRAECPDLST